MNQHGKHQHKVWILGLPHSGSTIFWRCWRKDVRFSCFDEPLTENLGLWFPRNNPKATFDEYCSLFDDNPSRFWSVYQPISPVEELDEVFTERQLNWLKLLFGANDCVVIDETHLHRHIGDVKRVTPGGYVIHLYRRARNFVTSHLLPRYGTGRGLSRSFAAVVRDRQNRQAFWERRDFFPGMRRGEVVGSDPRSKFGLLLDEAGYDAERIMRSTAVVRLLAYWHYSYHHLEETGRTLLGDRFYSVSYEELVYSTSATMRRLYGWLGLPGPNGVQYDDVHLPKAAYMQRDARWNECAAMAGFNIHEIDTLL